MNKLWFILLLISNTNSLQGPTTKNYGKINYTYAIQYGNQPTFQNTSKRIESTNFTSRIMNALNNTLNQLNQPNLIPNIKLYNDSLRKHFSGHFSNLMQNSSDAIKILIDIDLNRSQAMNTLEKPKLKYCVKIFDSAQNRTIDNFTDFIVSNERKYLTGTNETTPVDVLSFDGTQTVNNYQFESFQLTTSTPMSTETNTLSSLSTQGIAITNVEADTDLNIGNCNVKLQPNLKLVSLDNASSPQSTNFECSEIPTYWAIDVLSESIQDENSTNENTVKNVIHDMEILTDSNTVPGQQPCTVPPRKFCFSEETESVPSSHSRSLLCITDIVTSHAEVTECTSTKVDEIDDVIKLNSVTSMEFKQSPPNEADHNIHKILSKLILSRINDRFDPKFAKKLANETHINNFIIKNVIINNYFNITNSSNRSTTSDYSHRFTT